MAKFVDDVKRAEALVHGDVNIVYDPKFQPEVKQSYSDLFGSTSKKKKKDKLDLSLKSRSASKSSRVSSTPTRPITHQRFLNKVDNHPSSMFSFVLTQLINLCSVIVIER
jgi:hypothetical protein